MTRVLCFGSLNIDYVYKVKHIARVGETIFSSERNVFSGGKGLNQSVALGKAGAEVYHAGCAGSDGQFLLEILRNAGVDTGFIHVLPEQLTGHAIIQNDRDGNNCIVIHSGANQLITEEDIDHTLSHFAAGDYLVLQNEINNIPYIIKQASAREMKIVLNPSPLNEDIQRVALSGVDLLFVNEIEASEITGKGQDDIDGMIDALKRIGKTVLTLGDKGAVYIEDKKTVYQQIYKVKAVDTTAAGDTFTGYFLAGILRGDSAEAALDMAAKAAAITVSGRGAAPSIPTMEQVAAFHGDLQ